MNDRKYEINRGITLIALIITIIVLLILAGVGISILTNDNGILNKAQTAKEESASGAIMERWRILISESKLSKSQNEELQDDYIRTELANSGLVFLDTEWTNFILGQGKKVDNNNTIYYSQIKDIQNIIKDATLINISDSNDITLDSGEYYIDKEVNVQNCSIKTKDNSNVSLIVLNSTTINDTNFSKSAVDIGKNAKLTIYANAPISLYSGKANSGAVTQNAKAPGSAGAYAGIHVPATSTLTLSGSSVIKAYGGDAGDAGDITVNTAYGSGGAGGAGAGIGGNGGNGGTSTGAATGTSIEYAGAGETAGTINIYSEVYAYGGSGGSTGSVYVYSGSSTGAGGYPAAGIGGGGAGGRRRTEMQVVAVASQEDMQNIFILFYNLQLMV